MGVEVVSFRDCKFCGESFTDRGPASGIPRAYCSTVCHEADVQPKEPKKRQAMKRTASPSTQKRRPISPASSEQRQDVAEMACLVCRSPGPCHPAHIVDRSLVGEGQDDALAVIPLCPDCHRGYDDGDLSILEYLEPHHRDRLGFAVARHGLLRTLERVTHRRWVPVDEERKAA